MVSPVLCALAQSAFLGSSDMPVTPTSHECLCHSAPGHWVAGFSSFSSQLKCQPLFPHEHPPSLFHDPVLYFLQCNNHCLKLPCVCAMSPKASISLHTNRALCVSLTVKPSTEQALYARSHSSDEEFFSASVSHRSIVKAGPGTHIWPKQCPMSLTCCMYCPCPAFGLKKRFLIPKI